MKQLNSIAAPHIARYRLIVTKKKEQIVKGKLQSLDAQIAARYVAFETTIAARTIHSFSEDTGLQAVEDELRSCYRTRTKGLESILHGIEAVQPERLLEKCPYCGITLPSTHDHYLPAKRYPELAVHGLNLVPCCTICNEKKGDRWKNGAQRLFIHFYSDSIPSAQFLHVQLVPSPTGNAIGATFRIQRPTAVTVSDWSIIENHYSKLFLLDRYADSVNEEIANILGLCVDHLCDGGNGAENFVARAAARFNSIFGTNHWRTVLYQALATNQVFLNMVATKVQNECPNLS